MDGVVRRYTGARGPHVTLLLLAVTSLLAFATAGCDESPPLEGAPTTPIYVSPDGRGDYATLGDAVREAPAGATILLDPGAYELPGSLDVFRSLRIVGATSRQTVITATASGHVLGFSGYGRLELQGLSIRHTGGPDDEPADVVLLRGGQAVLRDCAVAGAVSGRVTVRTAAGKTFEPRGGAGLRVLGDAVVDLEECRFLDNTLAGVVAEPAARVNPSPDCRGLGRPQGPDSVVRADRPGPRDAGEVAAALEEDVPDLLRQMNVPGAVVSVVKDGRLLYAHGFGLADIEVGVPVDARSTRFRVASVTKLFTATAVMQLREDRLLRLNGDLGELVTASSPIAGRTGARHMTVADLLTHTAGFDERWIGIATAAGDTSPSLEEVVRDRAASRVLPPGVVSSYANYDGTLAGAAVETTAGVPFERWVERQILDPLGMSSTTFDPWAASGAAGAAADDFAAVHAARSYRWDGGQRALPADSFASAPSGGLWSTGADMAAFMLAHLEGGALPGATAGRILSPAGMALMHKRHFANGPPLPGYAYGFAERLIQSRRALQHTGEFNGYASILFLVPSERLGVFVAANADRPRLCDEIVVRLMQRFYPDRLQLGRPRPADRLAAGVPQFTGTYRTVRHAHRTLDKWLAFSLRDDLRVTAEPDGVLVIDDTRYTPIEPLVFREIYDDSYVTFARDAGGDVAFAFRGTSAYERLRWYETAQNQRRFVILFSIVLGCVAIAWVLAPTVSLVWHAPAWVRRLLARQPFAARDTGTARVARGMAGAVAAIDLAFLGIVGGALTGAAIRYGVPAWLTAALVLPLLGAALTAAMAGLTVTAWVRGWWTVAGRLIYTFVTLVAAFFVWFTDYWNLLGFRY
jgi:CubicO group peptidase (beta-lactamase class C family)